MEDTLDEFVVKIALDASAFAQGQRQAADSMKKTQEDLTKRGKLMEQSGKNVSQTLVSIRNEFLALGAAIIGSQGIKQFVEQMTAANVALANFSATINVAPQYVYGLNAAIKELGGSADDGANLLGALNKQIKDAQLQGGRLPASLTTLAGMVNMRLDQTHGPVEYLRSLAAAAKALADQGPESAAKASALLASGGFDTAQITAMEKYGAAIDKVASDRAKFGPSPEDFTSSKEFVQLWTQFGEEMGKLYQDTLPHLLGPINGLLGIINSALDRLNAYNRGDAASPSKQFLSNPRPGPEGNGMGGNLDPNAIDGVTVGGNPPVQSGGARAAGGPVTSGKRYLVGEQGPELFTPGSSGAITSNASLGGSVEVDGRPVSHGNPMPVTLTTREGDGPQSLWEWLFGKNAGGGGAAAGSGSSVVASLGNAASKLFGGSGVGNLPNGDNPTPGTATAGSVVSRLMKDYGFTRDQAVGAAGVMGYESGDFRVMQERGQSPGRGGWGWAQWTGPRRTSFMNWANEHKLDPASDAANYGFLQHELATNYASVVPIMRQQKSVDDAAYAWERHFEGMTEGGPGIPAFGAHIAKARQYDRLLPQNIGSATPDYPDHGFHGRSFPSALSLSSMGGQHNVTSSSTSNALHVGRIDVNAPRATNAAEIAGGISNALKMNMFAMLAQSGQI